MGKMAAGVSGCVGWVGVWAGGVRGGGREVIARLSSVNKLTMTSGFDRYACRVGLDHVDETEIGP